MNYEYLVIDYLKSYRGKTFTTFCLFWFLFLKIYLFYVWWASDLPGCMCTMAVPSAFWGQKMTSSSLELEFTMTVSHSVGVRNRARVLFKNIMCPPTPNYLQPWFFGSLRFFHGVAQTGLELSISLLQIQVWTTLSCFLLSLLKCLSSRFKLKLGI